MNKRLSRILIGLAAVILVSCAGTPTAEQGRMADAQPPAPAETAEESRVIVWKPVQETVMFVDGTVDKTVEYSYDDDGRLLETIERDSRNELLSHRSYAYDSGVLVRSEISDRTGLLSITQYESDVDGNLVVETKYDPEGRALSIVRYEYENGMVTRSDAGDGDGTPHLTAVYGYRGDVIEYVDYRLPGGTEEARFERTFQGDLITREQTVLADGSVETAREFRYDGNRLDEEVHYAGDSKIKTVRFEYDGNGNVIREIWSNRSGNDYEVLERRWLSFEMAE